VGIWTLTSTFGAWGIGDLWELDRTNCYSSKTPNYGRILDIVDGSHYCFQGRGVKGGQNS